MKRLALLLAALVASVALAQDAVTEARVKALAEELRCLVCQNQTIAESNAPLALDLRSQIRTQIAQGRSDSQIRDYMVQRYGDFVLYRPPLKGTTALLWGGPLVLLLVGGALFFTIVRKRQRVEAPVEAGHADERRQRARELLEREDRP